MVDRWRGAERAIAMPGLQLADALAFGLGRRFRRHVEYDRGQPSDLDVAAIAPLAALNGRSRSLDEEAHNSAQSRNSN